MKSSNQNTNEDVLICGETYHIYNKTVGNELLFKTNLDYEFFLKKMNRFILPVCNVYAYCLIPNHFHLLLKIKDFEEIPDLKNEEKETKFLTQKFSNFFISYSRSYNKVYNRLGRLMLQPFKRKIIDDEDYFSYLITYIHRNPIHHGLVSDFSDWKYSSYNALVNNENSLIKIERKEVLSYFKTVDDFTAFHQDAKVILNSEKYLIE